MSFFLIVVGICIVLLTISKIYGKKTAKKIIKTPLIAGIILLLIIIIVLALFLGFQFIKENWIAFCTIAIIVLLLFGYDKKIDG